MKKYLLSIIVIAAGLLLSPIVYAATQKIYIGAIGSNSDALLVWDTTSKFLGVGTSTPAQTLSVSGGMQLTGAFVDGNNASGTSGMVLQTTGTKTQWVATSTLGFQAQGSYVTNTYASSTFPSFGYASTTYVGFGYASTTFQPTITVLPVANGGTGTSTWMTNSIPFYNGTRFTENNPFLNWDNTNKQFHVGTTTGFTSNPVIPLDVGCDQNSYCGAYFQNKNIGNSASSDVQVAANNDGVGLFGHYGDLGIQNSNFSTTTNSTFSATAPGDIYLYGSGGNLVLGTDLTGSAIKFNTAGMMSTTTRMIISPTGLVGIGTTTPSGNFDVAATSTGASMLRVYTGTTANNLGKVVINPQNPGDVTGSEALEIDATSGLNSDFIFKVVTPTSSQFATFGFARASGTPTSLTNPANLLTPLGEVNAYMWVPSSNWVKTAAIRFGIDGVPATSSAPSKLQFYTTLSGSTGVAERMDIFNDGSVSIGNINSQGKLSVQGSSGSAAALFVINTSTGASLLKVAANGHEIFNQATAPVISNCGTGAAYIGTGTDKAGTIQTGTGAVTACTVTFTVAYTATPTCVVTASENSIFPTGSSTPTTLVIGGSSSVGATALSYVCFGTGTGN